MNEQMSDGGGIEKVLAALRGIWIERDEMQNTHAEILVRL